MTGSPVLQKVSEDEMVGQDLRIYWYLSPFIVQFLGRKYMLPRPPATYKHHQIMTESGCLTIMGCEMAVKLVRSLGPPHSGLDGPDAGEGGLVAVITFPSQLPTSRCRKHRRRTSSSLSWVSGEASELPIRWAGWERSQKDNTSSMVSFRSAAVIAGYFVICLFSLNSLSGVLPWSSRTWFSGRDVIIAQELRFVDDPVDCHLFSNDPCSNHLWTQTYLPPAYNLGSFRKIQVFKPFGSCLETWLIHGFWQFSDAPLTAPVVTRVTDVKVPADRTPVRAEIGRVQK